MSVGMAWKRMGKEFSFPSQSNKQILSAVETRVDGLFLG